MPTAKPVQSGAGRGARAQGAHRERQGGWGRQETGAAYEGMLKVDPENSVGAQNDLHSDSLCDLHMLAPHTW